jgi:hypothetical protein
VNVHARAVAVDGEPAKTTTECRPFGTAVGRFETTLS